MGSKIANLLQTCIDKKSIIAGKVLHAYILRTNLLTDTFLCNRLIELYSKCNDQTSAYRTFDQTPQKDIYSWNAILSCHCKAGNLTFARQVFEKMPERNVVSWNNLISLMLKNGYQEKALDVYGLMVLEGFLPTHVTFASVLSACGSVLDLQLGKRCHGLAIKIGLDKNIFVCNGLLSVYAKCGVMREAAKVFGDIHEPNEVSFTTMMGGLGNIHGVFEALEMFRIMHRKRVRMDSVSLSAVLNVCAKGGEYGEFGCYEENDRFLYNVVLGEQVHGLSVKLGFECDLFLSNSLLDMYAKNGIMKSAETVFHNLGKVSVVSWNIMIAGYGQKGKSEKAVEVLQRMQYCGFEPDEVTYINMLAACVKCGDVEAARQMFDSMSCPSVISWNAIISVYSQTENHKEAIELFREMQSQTVKPDRTTVAIILGSCAGMDFLDGGKQVHAASIKAALHTDSYVASGLIGMYSKCGKINMAKCIFSYAPELDIVCWNSMIAGLTLNSLDKEAFMLFKQMRQGRMLPTEFSYATVLSCCAKLSSSFQGRQVHSQIVKDGYENDVFVGTALVGMYRKCGDIDGAQKYFDMMPVRNIVTWNEMIHGYAQNGRGDEAVRLYQDMIASGEKPDGITFIAVLTACSHSGLVDLGVRIFNSMQSNYGLEPKLDHYTCIIDCLSRAGRFHDAELLMNKMPYKDDPIVWEVLLSSCRVHGNISLAQQAAKELFRLDPESSVPYVLLANIYSSLGRWEDVRAVRELMSDKQIVKDPGYSWTEDREQDTSLFVG
ncbi:pentatricopeptide repeat-containing protein At4g20770 [Durio zibethinus]|uniref:Pentatricopeptide repeat-containing protein At4g20770 n=1 Tax=Durio zibethinus TaxID=66656 RepID=A0A6P5WR75_DURZI|nr:pentatricopeptide repeat-containing protein At4g20770 [Durio zibethinus]XP_022718534.1 pentatricopeptide repeat-containing protein At4g20770 [Durio zibethinus]XP_022718535.1 pentatricopeptide repeat-containing protein At4g20770 [Durio zibethinus]XP_022718536.1 pentatricopeptide repeat-containing protein At4g20770 [Durio zibethinus]XP_022718537.1 pentatricopeptide repeat-containing protein At4g20770 [Durio zibethinus]XP_022718539.1 pentatricopeptide repeat-containing protein At4g20770 [Durio